MGFCLAFGPPGLRYKFIYLKLQTNKKTHHFYQRNNDRIFRLFHCVNCQSSWVIYIIECNICNLQYIGKSETAFNLRLNNHRNHIKKEVSSCELTEHFLHNKQTHNCDNNRINISNEQKKDILRHREIFWQRKLNSMQPNGLDKRIG